MKKAIIFDLDGTLLDTSQGIKKAIEDVINTLGLEALSGEELKEFIGPPIYESLSKRYGLDEPTLYEATELFRNIYKEKYLYEATVYEGLEETLRDLKSNGYILGVATNKRYDYVAPLLDKFGLLKYFDDVQGTDFANTLKKPDVIRNCLKKIDVLSKDYACMVGDTVQDFYGAKENRIDFLGVSYGFGFQDKSEYTLRIRIARDVFDMRRFFL